jgi:MFS transporter, YNFM family, putative membrane transport protein
VPRPRAFPIVVAGFSAFLDLYATQPLLPLLARTFHASNFAVSLTVTAPTLAVAFAAPIVGRLADRFGLRRTIVASAFALAVATALGATAITLPQLIFWRFVQGLVSPGIFSIAIAYIHQEWPAANAGSATAAYVGGTVVGGFMGRAATGVLTSAMSWQSSFAVLSAVNLAAAALIWWRLPQERVDAHTVHRSAARAVAAHVRNRRLLPTYGIGFCILCSQIAIFTYVTFHLAAPPFGLSTAALGWIFITYLLGAVVTPAAGPWIDRYGLRAAFIAAVVLGITASLLTLAPSLPVILIGLALFGTSVFVTQATASSHVAVNAAEAKGLAIGLYATCYYVGGTVGGAVPAAMWHTGGWPACVAFVVVVQLAMLTIASLLW